MNENTGSTGSEQQSQDTQGGQGSQSTEYMSTIKTLQEELATYKMQNDTFKKTVAELNQENERKKLAIAEYEKKVKAMAKGSTGSTSEIDPEAIANEAYEKGVMSLQSKYDEAVNSAKTATKQLQNFAITSALNGALAAGGYKHPDMIEATLTGPKRKYDYAYESGAVVVKYRDGQKKGQRVTSEQGGFMTIADVVTEYVKDKPDLIPTTKLSGSGSAQGSNNNTAFTAESVRNMSLDEFAKNQDAIFAMARQAGG